MSVAGSKDGTKTASCVDTEPVSLEPESIIFARLRYQYQTGSGLSLSTPPPALLAALTHRVFSSNDLSSSGPAKLWLKPSPPTALPEPIPWLRRGNGHWYHPGWMGRCIVEDMWNWQGFHIPNILKKFQHVPVGSQACLPRYSKFVGTQQDSKDLAPTNKSGRSPTGFSCSSRDVALELLPQDKHNWQRKTGQII